MNGLSFLLYFSGLIHLLIHIRRRVFRRYGIYILSYHHVIERCDSDRLGHDVTVKHFEEQLHFVKNQFDVVSLEQALGLLAGGSLNRDCVVITFDDGYQDNYRLAFPILCRSKIPATVFLITGLIGTDHVPWYDECREYLEAFATTKTAPIRQTEDPILVQIQKILSSRGKIDTKVERATDFLKTVNHRRRQEVLQLMRSRFQGTHSNKRRFRMMNWDQVREMACHGVTFGSHTVTHPVLTRMGANEAERQLTISKQNLEKKLATPCDAFAFPNGDFDPGIIEILKSGGYRSACTQIFGANEAGCNVFRLKRIGVGNIPHYTLAAKLSGFFTPIFRARSQWRKWHGSQLTPVSFQGQEGPS